jgi:hypothetical protein
MEPVRVVARSDQQGRCGDDTDAMAAEQRRRRLTNQPGEGIVEGPHLVVEVLDATRQATDHDIGRIRDRVRTLAGPHRSRFGHQSGLVTIVEPCPDLIRAADDDLAELVQRLVALHPCRTAGNH